jgi:hypothetical protein
MEFSLADRLNKASFWVNLENSVSIFNVKDVGKSRFALPLQCYDNFTSMSEVAMGWCQCVAKMKDGKELVIGGSMADVFYDFPLPYIGEDVVSVAGIGRDHEATVLERTSFDLFVSWPEEEQRSPSSF